MTTTMIEGMSADELKNFIMEAVKEMLKQHVTPETERSGYLTREETRKLLRISMPTLNEYTKNGTVKGYRVGGRVLYKEDEVLASVKEIVSIKHKRIG